MLEPMCGIAGYCLGPYDPPPGEGTINRMTDSIAHRGPDGEGFLHAPPAVLGHRRLSIIDVSGGDQPIFNEDRSIAIVFNGEIYNYRELKEQLLAQGHQFRTQSDTEVIVHLYEELGTECLEQLNGMFAFAIWDANRQLLFAARDRLGEKPFYYRELPGGGIIFGSEIKALRAFDAQLEIDQEALSQYLTYGYVPAPLTIYKQIRKLPAAHGLTWKVGQVRLSQYWRADQAESTSPSSEADMLDQLHHLLEDSTRIRLRSDVPVGAFLSGGIDSSLVVALASQLYEQTLTTFSVGFTEQDFDESEHAQRVADRFGTDHHAILVEDLNLDIFPDLVRQFDEPFADPSSVPTYFVTRAAANHLKVCLSGDAGDELFGGYPQYVAEPGETAISLLPRWLRKSVLGGLASALPDHIHGKGWLRRMAVSGSERYERVIGVFDSRERRDLLGAGFDYSKTNNPVFDRAFSVSGRSDVESRMACDLATYLVDDILVKVDRNSMLNSLEVRVPLLDHRLVEFAVKMPMSLKIRKGVQKWPLKELLRPLMPQSHVERRKQGFGLPIRDWLRTTYRDMAEELLLGNGNRSHEFLNASAIRRLFQAHLQGSRDFSDRLWTLMWFEQWCRIYRA